MFLHLSATVRRGACVVKGGVHGERGGGKNGEVGMHGKGGMHGEGGFKWQGGHASLADLGGA